VHSSNCSRRPCGPREALRQVIKRTEFLHQLNVGFARPRAVASAQQHETEQADEHDQSADLARLEVALRLHHYRADARQGRENFHEQRHDERQAEERCRFNSTEERWRQGLSAVVAQRLKRKERAMSSKSGSILISQRNGGTRRLRFFEI
jgi:hypothetical protein